METWSNKLNFRALAISSLAVIMMMCLPEAAAAQKGKPTGHSTITGRVVFADTGRPVRRAGVRLFTDLRRGPARATAANVRGEFRFTEVAAGSYFVVAEAPGVLFVRSAYAINEFGFGGDLELDQTRVTVDGTNSTTCELRVARAGTIKGTIIYADKEPVVNGRIVLFRRKGGVIVPYFSDFDATNDRGMYRIDGLPDGEYFVGVITGKSSASSNTRLEATDIPTAYYPGVVSVSEAKAIQIQSGAEVAGINMTLNDDSLRQISGVVKWRQNGTVAQGAVVSLRRKDTPKLDISLMGLFQSMMRSSDDDYSFGLKDVSLFARNFPPIAEADAKGEWTFNDVPPGTYVITAYAAPPDKNTKTASESSDDNPASTGDLDGKKLIFRRLEITIAEEDRKNVTIELPQGSRILGSVVSEESQPVDIPIPITVEQKGGSDWFMNFPQYSYADGTFALETVPSGDVTLDLDIRWVNDPYVKSITLNGQDLMREALRVNEGAEIAGVVITIGKGLATLNGRVQLKDDESPAAGGGVLLVKADPRLWHLRSSRYFAMADAAGEFTLNCAPGEYLVFTWSAGSQPMQTIEEFVRSHASAARRVSFQRTEVKRIELTVEAPRK